MSAQCSCPAKGTSAWYSAPARSVFSCFYGDESEFFREAPRGKAASGRSSSKSQVSSIKASPVSRSPCAIQERAAAPIYQRTVAGPIARNTGSDRSMSSRAPAKSPRKYARKPAMWSMNAPGSGLSRPPTSCLASASSRLASCQSPKAISTTPATSRYAACGSDRRYCAAYAWRRKVAVRDRLTSPFQYITLARAPCMSAASPNSPPPVAAGNDSSRTARASSSRFIRVNVRARTSWLRLSAGRPRPGPEHGQGFPKRRSASSYRPRLSPSVSAKWIRIDARARSVWGVEPRRSSALK